ncbi:MAG: radical SAM family heme chaperone HemW [Bacilli bacterium]
MESAYIHIPFCKSICSYCDFCKMLYYGPWVTKYLNELAKEIKDKYNMEELKTIYIGGGTPSALSLKDIKYLLDIITIFKVSEDLEYTFECNINDINEDLLKLLKQYGVNRLSIGIESFDQNKLEFMERMHTFEDAEAKIKLCRKLGFNNISVDLIYGIPKEDLKVLKKDLDLILKLNVDHISTYSLIVEDNTKVGNSKMIPISEDEDAKMYNYIVQRLESKKYNRYEISNFAKKGKESRHNLNYWNNNQYYGFGLGASGFIGDVRYENTRSLTSYLKGKYVLKQEIMTKEAMMDNELMLGFRKVDGINLQEFVNKYDVNMQEAYPLQKFLNSGEIIYDDGYVYINPKYLYVMNEILIKLL